MNRAQKIARFNLIVISTSLILSTIAVSVLYFAVGMPMRRAFGGLGFIGICGLMGLSPLLYKKERDKVSFDERDRLIKERATLGGFTAAYLFVGMACMIPFFVLGPKANVSVTWLPMIFMGACISHFLIHSIVILEQYGWRGKGEKS